MELSLTLAASHARVVRHKSQVIQTGKAHIQSQYHSRQELVSAATLLARETKQHVYIEAERLTAPSRRAAGTSPENQKTTERR